MKVTMKFAGAVFSVSLALGLSQSAWSNITDVVDLGAGNLSFDYGSSGFGSLTAWYVLPSGTESSFGVAGASGLSFNAQVSPPLPLGPGGTAQLLVTFDLTNTKGSATQPMKFIAEVDPNGADDRLDTPASHMVIGAHEPDRFEIDNATPVPSLLDQNIVNGQLNNAIAPACQSQPCDVDFALQWNIPALQPGETSRVIVSLSDDGQHNSASFLSATHVLPDDEEILTFSGTAQVVPEPETWLLLGAGIGVMVLGYARRRERARG